MPSSPPEVVVHAGPDELAAAVAARLASAIAEAQAARGSASVVLTGGGMGARVLRALREAGSRAESLVAWADLDVWWGDERFLPEGDPERNAVQAREALLDAVPVDPARVHPVPASRGPAADVDEAAAQYAEELAAAARATGVPGPVPVLDVLLLGVGPDGHVASLFPGSPAVDVEELAVVGVRDAPKPPPERVSLTMPTVTGAEQVWLVVAGADKADAVARALSEDGRLRGDPPAARVTGASRTLWLLDEAAAGGLGR